MPVVAVVWAAAQAQQQETQCLQAAVHQERAAVPVLPVVAVAQVHLVPMRPNLVG